MFSSSRGGGESIASLKRSKEATLLAMGGHFKLAKDREYVSYDFNLFWDKLEKELQKVLEDPDQYYSSMEELGWLKNQVYLTCTIPKEYQGRGGEDPQMVDVNIAMDDVPILYRGFQEILIMLISRIKRLSMRWRVNQ